MRKMLMFYLALALALPIATAISHAEPNKTPAAKAEKAAAQEFKISGMHCGACAKSIEKAFKTQGAVDSCQVDFKSGKMTLVFKPGQSLTKEQVAKTIADEGYELVN